MNGTAYITLRTRMIELVEAADDRTSIIDFADALIQVDERLRKYEAVKQGKWLTQDVGEHLDHAIHHASRFNLSLHSGQQSDDLAATAVRALMALQLGIKAR